MFVCVCVCVCARARACVRLCLWAPPCMHALNLKTSVIIKFVYTDYTTAKENL
jgi:hypothetical protein